VRFLVVGAGASADISGKALQAHRDVTFLVRARRAAGWRATGLSIKVRGRRCVAGAAVRFIGTD